MTIICICLKLGVITHNYECQSIGIKLCSRYNLHEAWSPSFLVLYLPHYLKYFRGEYVVTFLSSSVSQTYSFQFVHTLKVPFQIFRVPRMVFSGGDGWCISQWIQLEMISFWKLCFKRLVGGKSEYTLSWYTISVSREMSKILTEKYEWTSVPIRPLWPTHSKAIFYPLL